MNDNPEIVQPLYNEESKPIDTVVTTIIKRKSDRKNQLPTDNYQDLYSSIKNVLSKFDNSVSDCKKYNEAKIHRKYEIRIADLENEISILKDKIREQENARDPSKRYIEGLLDQLVQYRNENEKLREQNNNLQQLNAKLMGKQDIEQTGDSRANSILESMAQKKSQISFSDEEISKFNLKLQIQSFLEGKKLIRKNVDEAKTKFELFLRKNKEKMYFHSFQEFLMETDEWVTQSEKKNVNYKSERLKSNILSTLEDDVMSGRFPPINSELGFSRVGNSKFMKKKPQRKNYSTIDVMPRRSEKYMLK